MTKQTFGPNGSIIMPAASPTSGYTAPAGASTDYGYPGGDTRSLVGLFKWVRLGLLGYMGAEVLLTLSTVALAFVAADDPYAEDEGLLALYGAVGLVSVLYLAVLLFCVVMVARWTYRAIKNLHTVREVGAVMSPGWSVGWYFIPIANLWKPLQGMQQIFHGTGRLVGVDTQTQSPIAVWWGCWITTGFVSNASSQIPDYNMATAVLDIASGVLAIVATVFLLRIMGPTTQRQEQLQGSGVASAFD